MLIALVDGIRRSAFPKGKGHCPVCKNPMRAKCGPRVIHHWAHVSLVDCDPWGESETDWHREWKGRFPEDCREITYVADDGEIHRADVVTPTGIVVEIQHSSITDQERLSRELFYKNFVWVIDGRGFRGRFEIVHALPAPASDIAKDLVWFRAGRGHNGPNGGMFWRPSEHPEVVPGVDGQMVELHSMREIEEAVYEAYEGHHQYVWTRPHGTWLDATCPVYIDFGDEILVRLESFEQGRQGHLSCVRVLSKKQFMDEVMEKRRAIEVCANRGS